MLTIISSAKTLNFDNSFPKQELSNPMFLDTIHELIQLLKRYSEQQLAEIMNINPKLAHTNWCRFQDFQSQPTKPALFAYAGDVYNYIEALNLNNKQINFLQSHLLIISGLYGVLRPLDIIQAYRLEMATQLLEIKNLARFWQEKITNNINKILDNHQNKYLLNLASNEYSLVIGDMKHPVINIFFKENKNGKLQTIGINAKKARGNMINTIATHFIDNPEELKNFSYLDYKFNFNKSSSNSLVFVK